MKLKWINTAAFAAMIVVNLLANVLPIGGYTTGQVSAEYANLFTPAPLTFAIWGVIYLLLGVFVVWQWEVIDHGEYSARVRGDIGLWFAVSCAINIVWLLFWHNKQILQSVICMVLLLLSLIMIQKQLTNANGSKLNHLAAVSGFSLYYGWVIAATIANISVLLTKYGWKGWGLPADFWTVAVLFAGAAIACAVVITGKNSIAGGAVMWAFAGILYRHISSAYYNGAHPYVIAAGVLAELAILAALLMPVIRPMLLRKCCAAEHKNDDMEDREE